MPLLLRKVRKAKWLEDKNLPWLPTGELQADALTDIATDNGNELSVWVIDDSRSNVQQIIVALAIQRNVIANLDYVLIDVAALDTLRIARRRSLGNTIYEQAKQWHVDLVELSATKLFQLAKHIQVNCKPVRVQEREVVRYIAEAVLQDQIELARAPIEDKSKILQEIEKRRAQSS